LTLRPTAITDPSAATVDIDRLLGLVGPEMDAVDTRITDQLSSDVALINQLSGYIINAGGKRLRPVSVLLSAKACSLTQAAENESVVTLAAIIEFIHTATLLHDDVVDESSMRRGQETANEVWGNAASVLVGDFLYSRSFQMMVEVGSMRVMEILSHTTNRISEGEVMQLINCGSAETTEEQYMETIRCKTAILFAAATQLGAVITGQASAVENALRAYGLHLGIAFQLVDDILDYTADADAMGKNVGDDLAEGKPTLPLINALERGSKADQEIITDAITNASRDKLEEVMKIIESTGALGYTARRARQEAFEAQQALTIIPESSYKEAMMDLAAFAVERTH
jgi:octaprenyl-diphosphate synthase